MIKVTIPGGEATLRSEAAELSPRRRREVELLAARLGRVLEPIQTAGRLFCEGELMEDRSKVKVKMGPRKGKLAYPGPDLEVSELQMRLLTRLNDAIVWSLLESWTLDLPIPTTPDDMLDLPADLYDVIGQKAAEVYLGLDPSGGFGPGALPQPGSDQEPDTTRPTSA